MRAAYEAQRTSGGLPATYEIYYAAAFAGQPPGTRHMGGADEVVVPLARLRHQGSRR